eukprot:scaffold1085_cov407-Prasinococcus_capsulatus_cf.AAC.81
MSDAVAFVRIMYFSLQKAMEGHEYTFTRILHSMSDDELVDYIPTVRIKPRCDPQCRTNEYAALRCKTCHTGSYAVVGYQRAALLVGLVHHSFAVT